MTASARAKTKPCQECGAPMQGNPRGKRFCGQPCRLKFNNRRLQRGAELYDLFMSMRYDREAAKRLGVWALMCRMAQQMREDDFKDRGGRKSLRQPSEVLKDRADLRSVAMQLGPRSPNA